MPLTFYLIIGRYYVIMDSLGLIPGRVLAHDCLYTARVKLYPDGVREYLVSDRALWHEDGLEADKKIDSGRSVSCGGSDVPRAVRRARSAVKDIALCTDFAYFVTLTLDSGQIDRYDMREIVRKLNRWLDNRVRRDGLAYVLVPERHKDGAVHFHGFFNAALGVEWSGTMIPPSGGKPRRVAAQRRAERVSEGWRDVYNLPAWSLGYTTAIALWGDYKRAVGYVCKYIGKDMGGKVGGRWYYSGGVLGRPMVELCDMDIREAAQMPGAYEFDVPGVGSFVSVTVENPVESSVDSGAYEPEYWHTVRSTKRAYETYEQGAFWSMTVLKSGEGNANG